MSGRLLGWKRFSPTLGYEVVTFEVCKRDTLHSLEPMKSSTALVSTRSLNNIYELVPFGEQHCGFILFIVRFPTRYPELARSAHYQLCILLIFAFACYSGGRVTCGYEFTG